MAWNGHETIVVPTSTHGENRSAVCSEIEEGLRMDRHPGIVFRLGPAGRRPGLVGNPDVWEVVRVVQNVETRGDSAISEAASSLGLSAAEVRIAVEYYADYPAEIDAWLAKVDAQAVRTEEFHATEEATRQLVTSNEYRLKDTVEFYE